MNEREAEWTRAPQFICVVDQLHADSLDARAWVRAEVERLRAGVEAWQPRPMPGGKR